METLIEICQKWLNETYPETKFCSWHIKKTDLNQTPNFVLNFKGKVYYFNFLLQSNTITSKRKKIENCLLKNEIQVFEIINENDFKKIIEKIIKYETV